MSIRYTALSEIGLKMNENQDGLFCAADGESGIFLVADGMGGHQDGAWASAAIVKKPPFGGMATGLPYPVRDSLAEWRN